MATINLACYYDNWDGDNWEFEDDEYKEEDDNEFNC